MSRTKQTFALPRCRVHLTVEALENRRAPAVFTYTDVDGDIVTIRSSKGTFAGGVDDFTFAPAAGHQQLQLINLSNDGNEFAGADLSITAVRGPDGGDGRANVGYINATGVDLGAVTVDGDLGRIDAGDVVTATRGLASLAVQSLGRFDLSTQAAGGTLTSHIQGRVGALRVRSDVVRATFLVEGGADGRLGSVFVGGSVLGGSDGSSGIIHSTGDLGPVTVRGNVIGSSGNSSGGIGTSGNAAGIQIGGSVVAGSGDSSGIIRSDHNLGPVVIAGDVIGGPGNPSGTVSVGGNLAGIRVGGSLRGGTGMLAGTIAATGNMGPVTIGGDVAGGTNTGSGVVSADRIASVLVRGSVRGGPGPGTATGVIFADNRLGPVTIGGDVAGGAGPFSGRVASGDRFASVVVGGSLIGGDGDDSGQVQSTGAMGPETIRGNIIRGTGARAGLLEGGRLARVTVGGSVISGAIRSANDIGPILIRGSLLGATPLFSALISARGREAPVDGPDVAIASLTVLGRVEFARVLAGYNLDGVGVNADARVGPVLVGGDWVAASLAAGVQAGPDLKFGTPDDAPIAGGDVARRSRIASITIRGQVLGTLAAGDHFGWVADVIGALSIGGMLIPLQPNTAGFPNDVVAIGTTDDFDLREVRIV